MNYLILCLLLLTLGSIQGMAWYLLVKEKYKLAGAMVIVSVISFAGVSQYYKHLIATGVL